MRVALTDLLQSRAIVHPSNLISAVLDADGNLALNIAGYPRWQETPEGVDDARLTLTFLQVSSGALRFADLQADCDELLEELQAFRSSNVPFLSAPAHEVFCSSPLSDPMALYALVHDQLAEEGGVLAVEEVLNFGMGSF